MDAEAWGKLEKRLVALVRSAGPLRATRAAISDAFVRREVWKKLGYARLSDYADEHLGCSARSVQDIARAGRCFAVLPRLRDALVSGELGWTKVRQLVRVARRADLSTWIAHARQVTSDALAREMRRVDVGRVERGGHEGGRSRSHLFDVECTAEVRFQWRQVYLQAQRVHGGRLPYSVFAEMLAAETLSALPLDHDVELETDPAAGPLGAGVGWDAVPAAAAPSDRSGLASGASTPDAAAARDSAGERARVPDEPVPGEAPRVPLPRELLRIERAARASPSLAAAYREGRLTALQAAVLAPLVFAELDEGWVARWVRRAPRISLRLLRDDVEDAITLCEADFVTWCQTGGLPQNEGPCAASDDAADAADAAAGAGGRQIRARHSHPFETCAVRCSLEPAVKQLLRAVICTVRRQLERTTGALPSEGEALGLILDHAARPWRDGQRCVRMARTRAKGPPCPRQRPTRASPST